MSDGTERVQMQRLKPSGALEVGLPPRAPIAMDEPGQIMTLIERAIDKGTDPASLEKLVDLADRVMRRRAELDFHRDLVEFQRLVPDIARTDVVDYVSSSGKRVTFKYADFDTMRKAIDPVAQEFGFGLTFSSTMQGAYLVRRCTLLHRNGHSISSESPITTANNNPGMSEQQKFAAAETSASRRALASVLGLNLTEVDSGSEHDAGPISEEQAVTLQQLCEEVKADMVRFKAAFGIDDIRKLPVGRLAQATSMLEAKRKAPAKKP